MGKMYEDWNKLFCDQMVEEIRKFEKCPTKEQLCVIKDLIEVTNGLQEMEMAGAIRRIAEDRYGYDSGTGRFREMPMEMMGGMGGYDPELEFFEMFNASRGGRGGGRGRRRDSRGRFIANMMNAGGSSNGGQTIGTQGGTGGAGGSSGTTTGPMNGMPYYPYPPNEFGVGEEMPWYMMPWMMNAGGREYSGDRFGRDGRNGSEYEEMDEEERERMMNAGRGGRGGSSGRGSSSGSGRGGNRGGGRSSGGSSGGRGGRSGGSYNAYPNGSNIDDEEMYMLRQENGMPIMTPYNAHDKKEAPKKLTNEQYEEWMESLVGANGEEGPKWTKPQIEAEAKRAGIDISEYGIDAVWACTNLLYSDFCDVATKYGVSKPSYYINLAMAFLDDADYDGDAKEKLAAYYFYISQHNK